MSSQPGLPQDLAFHPLTPERWPDLEELFGERGASGGCWCMWWRLPRSEFVRQKGAGNKAALKRIVDSGEVPGILAYAGGKPAAWCAIGPRERYPALDRARTLKRVDDQPVWSVVCFFVAKQFRRQGITVPLLKAAVAFAATRGARIVEGYPVDKAGLPGAFVFTGPAATFRRAGFIEVHRWSPIRPIMRYHIGKKT